MPFSRKVSFKHLISFSFKAYSSFWNLERLPSLVQFWFFPGSKASTFMTGSRNIKKEKDGNKNQIYIFAGFGF